MSLGLLLLTQPSLALEPEEAELALVPLSAYGASVYGVGIALAAAQPHEAVSGSILVVGMRHTIASCPKPLNWLSLGLCLSSAQTAGYGALALADPDAPPGLIYARSWALGANVLLTRIFVENVLSTPVQFPHPTVMRWLEVGLALPQVVVASAPLVVGKVPERVDAVLAVWSAGFLAHGLIGLALDAAGSAHGSAVLSPEWIPVPVRQRGGIVWTISAGW